MGQSCRYIKCLFLTATSWTNQTRILSDLAKVYDPLGLVSPTTLWKVHIQRQLGEEVSTRQSYPSRFGQEVEKVARTSPWKLKCDKSDFTIQGANKVYPSSCLWWCKFTRSLAVNVQEALSDYHPPIYCWLDSTVALYWITGSGGYRQFIKNRLQTTKQHQDITWRHVPTDQNPGMWEM